MFISSVNCSSLCHIWDAFQLAHASFRLHCRRNSLVTSDSSQNIDSELSPNLLGEAPKIDIQLPEIDLGEDEEGPSSSLPAIKIYDDDTYTRFLVCGVACSLVITEISLINFVSLLFILMYGLECSPHGFNFSF